MGESSPLRGHLGTVDEAICCVMPLTRTELVGLVVLALGVELRARLAAMACLRDACVSAALLRAASFGTLLAKTKSKSKSRSKSKS